MNNREKNTYVRDCITRTLLDMMKSEDIRTITIDALVRTAGVARASFYRNYHSKEEVVAIYLHRLFADWKKQFQDIQTLEPDVLYTSMFHHIRKHKEFYLLIHRQHLSHLLLQDILENIGPRPDQPSSEAYPRAFFAYAMFGWIEEWIQRGMNEDIAAMIAMFPRHTPSQSSPSTCPS